MLQHRIIPCLLLQNGGLVKTVRFKNPKYVGDPINAVKIFNDKEVDELVILDIDASKQGRGPNYGLLSKINREAFMPLGYGGGINTLQDIEKILNLGFEKVIINTASIISPGFISDAAGICGSQSVVVCIDVIKGMFGKNLVYKHAGAKAAHDLDPVLWAVEMEKRGAGELILNSVDRDGTMAGYDIELIKKVTSSVKVPVVAMGGAGSTADLVQAVKEGGAAAVAAGSFFVFHGPHRAVLITYSGKMELKSALMDTSG